MGAFLPFTVTKGTLLLQARSLLRVHGGARPKGPHATAVVFHRRPSLLQPLAAQERWRFRLRGLRPQGHDVQAEGQGPFPAVVALHGCGGLGSTTAPISARHLDWGASFRLGLHRRLPRFLRFARPGRAMSRPRPDGAAWEGARRRRGAREAVAAAAVRRRSGARLAPRLVERRLCRALGTAPTASRRMGCRTSMRPSPSIRAAVRSSNRPSAATGRAVCS